MTRNTHTELGNIKKGDRFYFASDKKKIVYQLINEGSHLNHPEYNMVEDGQKIWPYNKIGKSVSSVIYLRSTLPQPNESCRLFELKVGDVFCFAADIVTEYAVIHNNCFDPESKYLVKNLATGVEQCSIDVSVIFLRKLLPNK